MTPQWTDGLPDNLEAAAADAVLWLQLFAKVLDGESFRLPTNHDTNRALLGQAIWNVQKYLEETKKLSC